MMIHKPFFSVGQIVRLPLPAPLHHHLGRPVWPEPLLRRELRARPRSLSDSSSTTTCPSAPATPRRAPAGRRARRPPRSDDASFLRRGGTGRPLLRRARAFAGAACTAPPLATDSLSLLLALPRSLPRSLPLSLPRSLPRSLPPSLLLSLFPSLPLAHSLTYTRTHSLTHTTHGTSGSCGTCRPSTARRPPGPSCRCVCVCA